MNTGKIQATVMGIRDGVRNYANVNAVRIRSKNYTLLILTDYMPTVGDIQGRVELVIGDEVVEFPEINGFFTHRNNTFELLLREEIHV